METIKMEMVPQVIQTLEFYLDKTPKGDIDLMAVDEDGDSWYVCTVTRQGRLVLHSGLPTNLGFSLDNDCRIKTTNN